MHSAVHTIHALPLMVYMRMLWCKQGKAWHTALTSLAGKRPLVVSQAIQQCPHEDLQDQLMRVHRACTLYCRDLAMVLLIVYFVSRFCSISGDLELCPACSIGIMIAIIARLSTTCS